MKTYNHLWEKFISDENIKLAIRNASLGKRKRKSVKRRLNNPNLKKKIINYANHFHNKKHTPKEIYDGIQRKKRIIIVPSFDELIIQHMLVNVLKPIIMKGMYYHSYASIPKRGGHRGKRAVERFIKHNPKLCKHILKMDVKKYFDSIPHDKLLAMLHRKIRDNKIMAIIEEIISVIPQGIPLGFYTSQWLANYYLQGLDHYIKEELRADFYIIYMDDMVLFGANKRKLHKVHLRVETFLRDKLGLNLKGNWQVFKFDYQNKYRFLDFMGFRFYRNRTTIRRSIMLKLTRKARKIYKSEKITIYSARQMLSYLGWIKATDTYGMYSEWIKPIISFQQLKRKVKRYDRNKNGRMRYELVQV